MSHMDHYAFECWWMQLDRPPSLLDSKKCPRAVRPAGGVTNHERSVTGMTDSSTSPGVPHHDDVNCPLCGSEGWPSSRFTRGFFAVCGTAWDFEGFVSQSEPCKLLVSARLDAALLKELVA